MSRALGIFSRMDRSRRDPVFSGLDNSHSYFDYFDSILSVNGGRDAKDSLNRRTSGRSRNELRRELKNPWIAGALNSAERRRAPRTHRQIEIRMIQEVEIGVQIEVS
jgi:hypothetical protein